MHVQLSEFPTLDHIRSSTPAAVQTQAVQDLISRTIGNRSAEFIVAIDESVGPVDKDTFVVIQLFVHGLEAGDWGMQPRGPENPGNQSIFTTRNPRFSQLKNPCFQS